MIPAPLQNLLDQVVGNNAFYTAKFAGRSTFETLSDIPFTTKAEWVEDQLNNPPYGTNLTYPIERYTRFCQTSGTTGKPMRWLDTNESWAWMLDNWEQVYRASGVVPGDKVFCAFSFGPFLGFWTAYDCASRMGCMAIPGGGLSSVARLKVILDNGVNALCCTPTYALHLAQVAAAEGLDLVGSTVRAVIVAGEPGGSIPATRAAIEQGFGATLYDHHGMTEVGPVTIPHAEGLQIITESYFAEVPETDESGLGELVLTTLGRVGSPLIRYRTGDLVRLRAEDGVLLGGILGRADDMRIVRGVNIYPAAVEAVLRRLPGIAEYRVRVKEVGALTELEIDIEPLESQSASERQQLVDGATKQLREAFSMRIPVALVESGALPRFELKANRWVDAP